LKEHGIQRKYSCSYSSQQNGVAERKNRHIAEITRAMLNEKNLLNYFWAEAVATTVYIMNRTPIVAVHGMTLEEKFISKKPNVSHFRVFGCIAYVHVPNEKRSKQDPKAKKCIFIGYSLEQKGYRCFNPSTRKLHVATPLWAKCEDETHTPKSGNLESSKTPKNSELDCRGQNTSNWGVLYINGKVLTIRCPKWPRMSHLDICSPSYGQKKGRELN